MWLPQLLSLWPSALCLLPICLINAAAAASGATVVVHPEARAPHDVSQVVAHDYASFSFPAHFFVNITGNATHPNRFSQDILNLLYDLSGSYRQIRVGGTSTDHVTWDASQTASQSYTGSSSNGIPIGLTVGPDFLTGIDNFPGVKWTWMLQLVNNTDAGRANAIDFGKALMQHFKENLTSLEIGNEPDMYAGSVRPSNYTAADYTQEWLPYAQQVSDELLKNNPYGLHERKLFQTCVLAEPYPGDAALAMENGWNVPNIFELGVGASGFAKSVSIHHYSITGRPWESLGHSLMNHTNIVRNLTQFLPQISYIKKNHPGVEVVFGETNSDALNLDQWQNAGVFGSALWMIDYLMYGMTLNIDRFNLIMGTWFSYTGWVPVEWEGREPYVRPPLYGHIVVSDVLGRHPNVRVSEIPLNMDTLAAYAVYQSDKLAKVILINLDEWNSTTPYPRPHGDISLKLPARVRGISVKRLTASGAAADEGIAYGGLSWNYTNGRLSQSGYSKAERVRVENGMAKLRLPSTEAALVLLDC